MKKYLPLVSLLIISGCDLPPEYDLYGHSSHYIEATEIRTVENGKVETYEDIKETKEYDNSGKKEIETTEVITTTKEEPKLKSNNKADTYIILDNRNKKPCQKKCADKKSCCDIAKKKATPPAKKKPVAKKAVACECKTECKTTCPKKPDCCNKAKPKPKPQPKPAAKPKAKAKDCCCENKKDKCCATKRPTKSPLKQIEEKKQPVVVVLSPEQEQQNAAIAKIRRQEKEKFEKVWETKPVTYEVNPKREGQLVDGAIVDGLAYLSSVPSPVCLSDPNLSYAKNAYKRILETSESCCRTYITNIMKEKYGKDNTYKFLIDDYNFYKAGELCMFYSDQDIADIFGASKSWDIVKEARNQCACQNSYGIKRDAKILRTVLDHKNLEKKSITYTMKDEFGKTSYRNISDDINNLSNKLQSCSK